MHALWGKDRLGRSIIAVPPLARKEDGTICPAENERMVGRLEEGGVRTLLYGGNAVLYHVSPKEYPELVSLLRGIGERETVVIPSVGPGFGMMMEQAKILREFEFPTAMVLPTRDMAARDGVATGIRKFAESFGKSVVVYLKFEEYLDLDNLRSLVNDGVVSWIKYAVVRAKPDEDPYLRSLVDGIGPEGIVSGMGEQPAVVHLREFGLSGFTSGCVCVAPALSMAMLRSIQSSDYSRAESIREDFRPLEDLRNDINPVTVLHEAVRLAGIAETGPMLSLLEPLPEASRSSTRIAATKLAYKEKVFAKSSKENS